MSIVAEGLSFPEAPRWHDGYWYYSDFYRHVVERVGADNKVELVAEVPQQPSGLGWLPDGRLIIVSMVDRKLLVQQADGSLNEYADLSDIATWHCNDMLVDRHGRAYVGHFGFDTHGDPIVEKSADLILVDIDGSISVAASELQFPNGTIITDNGKTLVVAETRGRCLTAFDVASDGSLSNRRVWAALGDHVPDGICLDAEGLIWLADPANSCVLRVREGGEIAERLDFSQRTYACALGGDDGRTLCVCTAAGSGPVARSQRSGRIETARVATPCVA